MPTLAYFLTWTTHGTWLHGDDRGSVDRFHNTPDTPHLAPDPARQAAQAFRMTGPAACLRHDHRIVVEAAIRDHCEFRGWQLHALNVRSNHVHVVVECSANIPPERAMTQLKARSTRRLREHGFPAAKVWTEHGSTRWIKTPESLAAAIDYVTNHQD